MIGGAVLLGLLPIVATIALVQRRRLYAVIGMTVFSLLLAAVYLLSAAPDVAITEAALGSALVTFVYILAIRKTGRLVVAAAETPGLIHRENDRIAGLEWDLLTEVSRELGLELVVRFVSYDEILPMVERGDADVGAGGLVSQANEAVLRTTGFLPTAFFDVRSPGAVGENSRQLSGYFSDLVETIQRSGDLSVRLDLARFIALSRYGLSGYEAVRRDGEAEYAFVVSPQRSSIRQRIDDVLRRGAQSGRLDELIRRHFQ